MGIYIWYTCIYIYICIFIMHTKYWIVAQHLNHCATAVPTYIYIYISGWAILEIEVVGNFSGLLFQKIPFLSNDLYYVAPLWEKVVGLIDGNVSVIYTCIFTHWYNSRLPIFKRPVSLYIQYPSSRHISAITPQFPFIRPNLQISHFLLRCYINSVTFLVHLCPLFLGVCLCYNSFLCKN